jgi:hypothetical protein
LATVRRVAIPDLRDRKGVRVEPAKRWSQDEVDVDLTRPIGFLTTLLVTGFSPAGRDRARPPTYNMARLSKFFNAPIANLRRFPPELFIRKADKKFQKKEDFARCGAL